MRSVTFISDNGTTVHFGAVPPFYFNSLTDSLGATAESVKPPRSAGKRTYFVSLSERAIVLKGQLYPVGDRLTGAAKQRDFYKTHLGRAFLPNTWGLLIYHTEDGDKQIRCRATATPTVTEGENKLLSDISIDFDTDGALWESTDLHTAIIGGFIPMFYFPWSPRPAPMGLYAPRATVVNDWVEEIYPTVEIYSTSQTVTISNETTGAQMTINHPIGAGQKLVVDMADVYAVLWELDGGGNYVELEDVSQWLTNDSDPWGLAPGGNVISVINEDPNDTPLSYIQFRRQYGMV